MTNPKLQDIPIEVFLDHLLPSIDLPDLLSLAQTSKFFALLCADDTFWKLKLKDDYNFSNTDARNKGFKSLYRGIKNPQLYVWGEKSRGRLGIDDSAHVALQRGGIPYPIQLRIKDTRVVNIAAGGWSTHVIDDSGHLHVWGTLDADSFSFGSDPDYSDASEEASTPTRLELPEPIQGISAGRKHLLALDVKHQVWLFTAWGTPVRLVYPLIEGDASSATSHVVQVEAGWDFIAVLTASGSVYTEWPWGGVLKNKLEEHTRELELQQVVVPAQDGVIHCKTWELHHDLLELPPIPSSLPSISPLTSEVDELGNDVGKEERRLVKIAGGEGFLIGLTNEGHVLRIDFNIDYEDQDLSRLRDAFRRRTCQWEYLPDFSELERIQQHPVFSHGLSILDSRGDTNVTPPVRLQITHISASFRTFVAYSVGNSSVVLIGSSRSGEHATSPKVIPGLQSRDIVSVVLGDYHYAALTQDGHLFTWGQYSKGALGLGDPSKIPPGQPGGFALPHPGGGRTPSSPPSVEVPSEVFFDHEDGKGDKFVFAIAACGWHTVALVIDVDYAKDKEHKIPVRPDDDDTTSITSGDEQAWNEANAPSRPYPRPGIALRGPFLNSVDEVIGSFPRLRRSGNPPVLPIQLRHARVGFAGRGRGRGFPSAGGTELPRAPGLGASQEATSGDEEVEDSSGGHAGTFRGRALAGGFRGLPGGRGRRREE